MHFTALFSLAAVCSVAISAPTQQYNTTVSAQMTASSTTTSTTACPTTPEAGTYCGFINPEDPCSPQPGGYGPKMVPDTISAFEQYPPFQSMALNASTPVGYTSVFKNLSSAAITPDYIGLYLLQTYNISACAAKCNEITGCNSFNIYAERDPSLNPTKNDSTAATVYGYWCPNPESMTNWKCALWSKDIDTSTATNSGEMREDFQVVIAGSNGYVKSAYYNSTLYHAGNSSVSNVTMYTGAASAGAGASMSLWVGLVLGVGLLQFGV